VDRRSFLKLGALSIPALGGGWIGAAMRSPSGPRSITPSGVARSDEGTWGPLIGLADQSAAKAYAVHGVLLPTGQVLMAGGVGHSYIEFMLDPSATASTITVEPMSVPTDRPGHYLLCGGHAPLADGRLLIAGGSAPGDTVLRYARLFDPLDQTWTRIRPDMAGGPRWYATVTRLPDDRLLVTGGFFDFGLRPNRSVEIFDPSAYGTGSNPWKELISHAANPWLIEPTGEDYTHVFLLPRPVVVAGHARQLVMVGKTGVMHFFNYTDPFTPAALRFAVRPHGRRPGSVRPFPARAASSLMLPDGRIMLVGGSSDRTLQRRADLYDPVDDSWQSIDTGIRRIWPTAMLLPDGTVLIVSGEGADGSGPDARTPQIIDPRSGRVRTGPEWPDPHDRGYHNVGLLLPDGRVLTAGGAGGRNRTPNNERTDLRYYVPGYLSNPGLRPRIAVAPAAMRYGAPYRIHHENGPVHRVTMLALGGMTHAFDENQRFVELFEGESVRGELVVNGPADGFAAPPGDYLLFLLRRAVGDGRIVEVPSVAKVVRLLPA
jgi:hypothetical protein